MNKYNAIIVGAGHNGLIAAAYLAKAGKKVLVAERRPTIGGIVATEEIFSGFKYTTCAHLCDSFSSQIIEELELKSHGLEILPLDPLRFAPLPEGDSLLIPQATAKTADEISRFSKADAARFNDFCALVKKLASFLRALSKVPLPDRVSRERLGINQARLEISPPRKKTHARVPPGAAHEHRRFPERVVRDRRVKSCHCKQRHLCNVLRSASSGNLIRFPA